MSAFDDYKKFLESFAQDSQNKQIRNGYAIYLCSKGVNRKDGLKFASSVLEKCFMQDSSYSFNKTHKIYVYSSLRNLESRIFSLKKNIKVNWCNNKIQTLLLQPFNVAWMEKIKPLPCTSTSAVDEVLLPRDGTQGQDVFPSQVTQLAELPVKKLPSDCTHWNLIRQRPYIERMFVTLKDFDSLVESFSQDGVKGVIRMGYVFYLYSRCASKKEGMDAAVIALDEAYRKDPSYVSNQTGIRSSFNYFVKKISHLKKHLNTNWIKIQDLFSLPATASKTVRKKKTKEPFSSSDISPVIHDEIIIQQPLEATQQQQSAHLNQSTEKQLKTDCVKCSTIRKSYSQAISEIRVKLRSTRKGLKEISKTYNVTVVNQTLKRKDAARQRLRSERKALRKENSKLKNEIKRLKSVVVQRIFKSDESEAYTYKIGDDLSQISLEREINNITKEIKSREERIQELGLEVDSLKCELNKLQQYAVTQMEITPGDSILESHSQRCDEDVTMIPKYVDRSVGWIEPEKCTDIPANVVIEIEDQTHIKCLDNGALELWNHKSSGGDGATNAAAIFSTVKIEISKLAFKSMNGKYWSLQTDGRVVSTAETIGDREHFEPVFKDGKVAFIGYNNCFLSHNDDGDIVCLSSSADPKIWFKLLRSNVAKMNDPLRKLKLQDVQVNK